MVHGRGVFTSDEGGWTHAGALEQKRGVVCGAAAEELCCRNTVQEETMEALLNGKLRLVWIGDGSTYEGEWVNGKCHGRGISTYADGAR